MVSLLMTVGFFRELLGSGKLFGLEICPLISNGGWYQPNGSMLFRAFSILPDGFMIWRSVCSNQNK